MYDVWSDRRLTDLAVQQEVSIMDTFTEVFHNTSILIIPNRLKCDTWKNYLQMYELLDI